MHGSSEKTSVDPNAYMGVEAVPCAAAGKPGTGHHLEIRPLTDRFPVDVKNFTLVVNKPRQGMRQIVHESFHKRRYELYDGGRNARTYFATTTQEALEEAVDYMLIPKPDALVPHLLAAYATHDPDGKGMGTKEVKNIVLPGLGLTVRQLRMLGGHVDGRTYFDGNFAEANHRLKKQGLIERLGEAHLFAVTKSGLETHAKAELMRSNPPGLPTRTTRVNMPDDLDLAGQFRLLVEQLGPFCQGCGHGPVHNPGDLTPGHKTPAEEGGDDAPQNLAPLCRRCVDRKGSELTLTGLRKRNLAQGWMIDGQVLRRWQVSMDKKRG